MYLKTILLFTVLNQFFLLLVWLQSKYSLVINMRLHARSHQIEECNVFEEYVWMSACDDRTWLYCASRNVHFAHLHLLYTATFCRLFLYRTELCTCELYWVVFHILLFCACYSTRKNYDSLTLCSVLSGWFFLVLLFYCPSGTNMFYLNRIKFRSLKRHRDFPDNRVECSYIAV